MLDERHAMHAIKEKRVAFSKVGNLRSYACESKRNAYLTNGVVTKYGYILDTASYGSLQACKSTCF